MIQGLISFIIGCSIILGITILITKQWYKHTDTQPKKGMSRESIVDWANMNRPTTRQQRRADVIHEYINRNLNKSGNN